MMNRGDQREAIFRDEADREKCLWTLTRAAFSTCGRQEAISYVQPSVFDMLAGASPASAMDGWAE